MRPLIEILEDERTQLMKLESIRRTIVKVEDDEVLDILIGQKVRHERNLINIRHELREYVTELFKQ